jgi:hypothetical protein
LHNEEDIRQKNFFLNTKLCKQKEDLLHQSMTNIFTLTQICSFCSFSKGKNGFSTTQNNNNKEKINFIITIFTAIF